MVGINSPPNIFKIFARSVVVADEEMGCRDEGEQSKLLVAASSQSSREGKMNPLSL